MNRKTIQLTDAVLGDSDSRDEGAATVADRSEPTSPQGRRGADQGRTLQT